MESRLRSRAPIRFRSSVADVRRSPVPPGPSVAVWRCLAAIAALALLTAPLAGCKGGGDEAGESGAEEGGESGGASSGAGKAETPGDDEPTAASARLDLAIERALLEEAARAELDADGLFVDLGTVDGHKYTRGGFATGWGPNEASSEVTYAPLMRNAGVLHLPPMLNASKAVVVKARSMCTAQSLRVLEQDAQPLSEDWQVLRFDVEPKAGEPLTFDLAAECPQGAMHVDWVWLPYGAGDAPPVVAGDAVIPRQTTLTFDGSPKRALDASAGQAYHFYVDVPEGAKLVVDRGAASAVEFVALAHTDGAIEPLELMTMPAVAGQWTESVLDLSPVAGKVARISLHVEGEGEAGWGEPDLMVPRVDDDAKGMGFGSAPERVVLVTVDGLRHDAVAALVESPVAGATPNLDAWVAAGTSFDAAFSPAVWPRPSAASLLASLSPVTHGIRDDAARLPDDVELLSERLGEAGWSTAAFVTHATLDDAFGLNQGWTEWTQSPDDGSAVNAALAWLGSQTGPSFVWVDLSSTHLPWSNEAGVGYGPGVRAIEGVGTPESGDGVAGDGAPGAVTAEDVAAAKIGYTAEVATIDAAVGALRAGIEAEGTLMILAGTHGAELGDHVEHIGHGTSHGLENVRVPLVLSLPGLLPEGRRVDTLVELVDVAPTVLELVDLGAGEHHQGLSLTGAIEGDLTVRPPVALAHHPDGRVTLAMPGRWLLARPTGGGKALTGPDEEAGTLETRLAWLHFGEAWANPTKSRRMDDKRHDLKFDSVEVDMDPELKKQLEALGYFGD